MSEEKKEKYKQSNIFEKTVTTHEDAISNVEQEAVPYSPTGENCQRSWTYADDHINVFNSQTGATNTNAITGMSTISIERLKQRQQSFVDNNNGKHGQLIYENVNRLVSKAAQKKNKRASKQFITYDVNKIRK